MRSLLQTTTADYAELKPDATAGFVLAFAIVFFAFVVIIGYLVFITARFKEMRYRLENLEHHPKLVAKDGLDD